MADIILHFHTGNQCSNGFGHHSTCPEPTWRYICGDLGGGLWGCTHYPPFSKEVADVLDSCLLSRFRSIQKLLNSNDTRDRTINRDSAQ